MKRSVSSQVIAACLTGGITAVAACGDGTAPGPELERIPAALTADPDSVSLPVGDAIELEVTVLDDSGGVLSGIPLEFSSSDTTVVTVDPQGHVTAVNAGVASVTLRCQSIQLTLPTVVWEHFAGSFQGWVALDGSGYGIALTSVGNAYVTRPGDNILSRIDLSTKTHVTDIPVGDFPTDVVIDEDGARAYVSNRWDSNVSVVDLTKDSVVDTYRLSGPPLRLALSPDGTLFATIDPGSRQPGWLEMINTRTGATTSRFSAIGPRPNGIAFHPARSSRIYVSHMSVAVGVYEINRATGDVERQFIEPYPELSELQGITISPDGTRLYVAAGVTAAHPGGQVGVWDLDDGTKLTAVSLDSTVEYAKGGAGGGFGVALSPDGIWLAVSLPWPEQKISIINTVGLQVSARLPSYSGGDPYRLEWTSDGTTLAVAIGYPGPSGPLEKGGLQIFAHSVTHE